MAGKKHPGAPTRAIEVLDASGVEYLLHEYDHSTRARSYGLEAARQLGEDARQVFKTLLVRADDEYVVAVVPVDHHLSMKAIAKASGHKSADMADPQAAQRRTGYVVGGISPLGQATTHRTFLDETCLEHETIMVSGGRRGLQVEISPLDLIELTGAEVVDLRALD